MAGAKSPVENEVKLRVESPQAAAELLERSGFAVIHPRIFESNDVYDTPENSLRARGELLRLRDTGGTPVLTFKGRETPGPHKNRPEFETSLDDARALREIFERLGLDVRFRYEKYRTEFRRGSEEGIATLDETPIGTFLELEGEPEWLDRTARDLGFHPGQYLLKSYGSLYKEYCEAQGVTPGNMTFTPANKGLK